MSHHSYVLVIASAGPFRDGLRVLLQARPDIAQIALAESLVEGCQLIAQRSPDAIVVDANLLEQASFEAQLERCKTLARQARQVVIVHTQAQQQYARDVGLASLLAGFAAEDLFAAISV